MSMTIFHKTRRAMDEAEALLKRQGGSRLDAEHLFYGVIKVLEDETLEILGLETADLPGLLADLTRATSTSGKHFEDQIPAGGSKDTPRCETIFNCARGRSLFENQEDVVSTKYLLEAFVKCRHGCIDGDAATLARRYLKPTPQPGGTREPLFRDVLERLRHSVPEQKAPVTQLFLAFEQCWERQIVSDRPIGVFWFVGPSGVGKSKLAADFQYAVFRDAEGIVRIDMSPPGSNTGTQRPIGSHQRRPNHFPSQALADAVRQNPDCVVLLQNVDQAHPDALDSLLDICTEGRLNDGQGGSVDFSRTIVIMTSDTDPVDGSGLEFAGNIGSNGASRSLEGQSETPPDDQRSSFPALTPGIRACIDEVIVFRPLVRDLRSTLLRQAIHESFPGLEEREISFVITRGARDWLFERVEPGKDVLRHFKRLIEEHITPHIYAGPDALKIPDERAVFVEIEGDEIAIKTESRTLLGDALEEATYGMPFGWLLDDREIMVDITPEGAEWLAERIHNLNPQREFQEIPIEAEYLPLPRVFGESKLHAVEVVLNRYVASPLMGWFLKDLIPDHRSVRFHPKGDELTMTVSDGPITMKTTDTGQQEWWLRRDIPQTKGIPVQKLIEERRVDPRLVTDRRDHIPEDLWEYLEKWARFLPEPVLKWSLARSSELGLVWPWRIGWYWEHFPDDPEDPNDPNGGESEPEEEPPQSPRPPRYNIVDNYYLIEPVQGDDADTEQS